MCTKTTRIPYFLPSELARLVLGYIENGGYKMTYKYLLKECEHLREYAEFLKQGRAYPTTVMGKNLVELMEDYAELKLKYMNHEKEMHSTLNLTLWNQLENTVRELKHNTGNRLQFRQECNQGGRSRRGNLKKSTRKNMRVVMTDGIHLSDISNAASQRKEQDASQTVRHIVSLDNLVENNESEESAEHISEVDIPVSAVAREKDCKESSKYLKQNNDCVQLKSNTNTNYSVRTHVSLEENTPATPVCIATLKNGKTSEVEQHLKGMNSLENPEEEEASGIEAAHQLPLDRIPAVTSSSNLLPSEEFEPNISQRKSATNVFDKFSSEFQGSPYLDDCVGKCPNSVRINSNINSPHSVQSLTCVSVHASSPARNDGINSPRSVRSAAQSTSGGFIRHEGNNDMTHPHSLRCVSDVQVNSPHSVKSVTCSIQNSPCNVMQSSNDNFNYPSSVKSIDCVNNPHSIASSIDHCINSPRLVHQELNSIPNSHTVDCLPVSAHSSPCPSIRQPDVAFVQPNDDIQPGPYPSSPYISDKAQPSPLMNVVQYSQSSQNYSTNSPHPIYMSNPATPVQNCVDSTVVHCSPLTNTLVCHKQNVESHSQNSRLTQENLSATAENNEINQVTNVLIDKDSSHPDNFVTEVNKRVTIENDRVDNNNEKEIIPVETKQNKLAAMNSDQVFDSQPIEKFAPTAGEVMDRQNRVRPSPRPIVLDEAARHAEDVNMSSTSPKICTTSGADGIFTDFSLTSFAGIGFTTPTKRSGDTQFSNFSTPFKSDTCSIIGKSPKRKRHNPKKRSVGGMTKSSSENNSTESGGEKDVIVPLFLKKVIKDQSFTTKLAETINSTRLSHEHSSHSDDKKTVGETEELKENEANNSTNSVEDILGLQAMSEDTVQRIIKMTEDDPAFDGLFNLFNPDVPLEKSDDSLHPTSPITATDAHRPTSDNPVNIDVEKTEMDLNKILQTDITDKACRNDYIITCNTTQIAGEPVTTLLHITEKKKTNVELPIENALSVRTSSNNATSYMDSDKSKFKTRNIHNIKDIQTTVSNGDLNINTTASINVSRQNEPSKISTSAVSNIPVCVGSYSVQPSVTHGRTAVNDLQSTPYSKSSVIPQPNVIQYSTENTGVLADWQNSERLSSTNGNNCNSPLTGECCMPRSLPNSNLCSNNLLDQNSPISSPCSTTSNNCMITDTKVSGAQSMSSYQAYKGANTFRHSENSFQLSNVSLRTRSSTKQQRTVDNMKSDSCLKTSSPCVQKNYSALNVSSESNSITSVHSNINSRDKLTSSAHICSYQQNSSIQLQSSNTDFLDPEPAYIDQNENCAFDSSLPIKCQKDILSQAEISLSSMKDVDQLHLSENSPHTTTDSSVNDDSVVCKPIRQLLSSTLHIQPEALTTDRDRAKEKKGHHSESVIQGQENICIEDHPQFKQLRNLLTDGHCKSPSSSSVITCKSSAVNSQVESLTYNSTSKEKAKHSVHMSNASIDSSVKKLNDSISLSPAVDSPGSAGILIIDERKEDKHKCHTSQIRKQRTPVKIAPKPTPEKKTPRKIVPKPSGVWSTGLTALLSMVSPSKKKQNTIVKSPRSASKKASQATSQHDQAELSKRISSSDKSTHKDSKSVSPKNVKSCAHTKLVSDSEMKLNTSTEECLDIANSYVEANKQNMNSGQILIPVSASTLPETTIQSASTILSKVDCSSTVNNGNEASQKQTTENAQSYFLLSPCGKVLYEVPVIETEFVDSLPTCASNVVLFSQEGVPIYNQCPINNNVNESTESKVSTQSTELSSQSTSIVNSFAQSVDSSNMNNTLTSVNSHQTSNNTTKNTEFPAQNLNHKHHPSKDQPSATKKKENLMSSQLTSSEVTSICATVTSVSSKNLTSDNTEQVSVKKNKKLTSPAQSGRTRSRRKSACSNKSDSLSTVHGYFCSPNSDGTVEIQTPTPDKSFVSTKKQHVNRLIHVKKLDFGGEEKTEAVIDTEKIKRIRHGQIKKLFTTETKESPQNTKNAKHGSALNEINEITETSKRAQRKAKKTSRTKAAKDNQKMSDKIESSNSEQLPISFKPLGIIPHSDNLAGDQSCASVTLNSAELQQQQHPVANPKNTNVENDAIDPQFKAQNRTPLKNLKSEVVIDESMVQQTVARLQSPGKFQPIKINASSEETAAKKTTKKTSRKKAKKCRSTESDTEEPKSKKRKVSVQHKLAEGLETIDVGQILSKIYS